MTESARMFLTGPRVVEAALGERVSMEDLGGPGVHSQKRRLPARRRRRRRRRRPRPRAARPAAAEDRGAAARERRSRLDPEARSRGGVPDDPRRVYDVRDPARAIVDAGELLELWPDWARNMVTALARIDGRPGRA